MHWFIKLNLATDVLCHCPLYLEETETSSLGKVMQQAFPHFLLLSIGRWNKCLH